jgi:Mg2+ and Co2+ transporter CorA
MEAVRSSWTDDRLDLLNERVEERFDQVDRRFDEIDRRFVEIDRHFVEVNRRFEHVEVRLARLETLYEGMAVRLDSIQRVIVYGVITITGGMIAGFSAIVALVATQI